MDTSLVSVTHFSYFLFENFWVFFPIYYSFQYNPPFHAVTCRPMASKLAALGSIQRAASLQAHVPAAPGAEVVGVPLVSGAHFRSPGQNKGPQATAGARESRLQKAGISSTKDTH